MFKCENCKTNTKEMFKVVSKKRPKEYYNAIFRRHNKNEKLVVNKKDEVLFNKLKEEKWLFVKDWISRGWEIVEELSLCNECYQKESFKIKI